MRHSVSGGRAVGPRITPFERESPDHGYYVLAAMRNASPFANWLDVRTHSTQLSHSHGMPLACEDACFASTATGSNEGLYTRAETRASQNPLVFRSVRRGERQTQKIVAAAGFPSDGHIGGTVGCVAELQRCSLGDTSVHPCNKAVWTRFASSSRICSLFEAGCTPSCTSEVPSATPRA